MKLPLTITLILLTTPALAQDESPTIPPSAQRFLHWGDQGDGTYANPILNGDFADADVEKHGDRWVLITSTNHLSPGMTILESKDLVNWRYTGHAFPSLSWEPQYAWDQMNGYSWGVWAGDLCWHEERQEWLCYQIDFQSGLYLSRAKDIHGPWSAEPECLFKRAHSTDPAVFFDDEKKEAWLLINHGTPSASGKGIDHELRLHRLSWDGGTILDPEGGHTLWKGHKVEAAKIRRFHDQWYVMMIEWQGTGPDRDRKQLCLRSTTDSIYGPYESRTVMERESNDHRSACQGSLIEAPDGRWWFLHQLVQNGKPRFMGRPQCLQPVTWVDGWPIIGKDIDGDGIGEPVWTHEKPMASDRETAFHLQTSDEFDDPDHRLGPQWNWNHEPRNERWSLTAREGHLRLIASKWTQADRDKLKGPFWGAPNTLSQRQLGIGKTRVEAKLDISGLKPGTRTGITHFSGFFPGMKTGSYALFGVHEENDGQRVLFFIDQDSATAGEELSPEVETIYLRSDTDFDRATFSWSLDGETWNQTDHTHQLTFGSWRGNRPGLFCWNARTDEPTETGWVDVDWFRYSPLNH
ncbi:MAG: glycoside hydrolase 43 family protein [Verrucomicrobiae bacterium]|nr:glycoside hydrolase 43 family protein [Verrucomicrobiae bacterium]